MKTLVKKCALLTGLALGVAQFANADIIVTFQVDMSAQIGNHSFVPGTNTVSANGTFNNWGPGLALTNNPTGSNPALYIGTLDDTVDANGGIMQMKYVIDGTNYETTLVPYANRIFILPTTNGASFSLPYVYFGDAGPAQAYNVTFQVDMQQQIDWGNFIPGTSGIYAQGSFNGWTDSLGLTNDPSILRTNQIGLVTSNVYTGIFQFNTSPGATAEYKYVINTASGDDFENPSYADGDTNNDNNRFFFYQTQVLPLVNFSDEPSLALVTVPGTANIFGAGHAIPPDPGGGGGGTLPPQIVLPPGILYVTFPAVTGLIATATVGTPSPPDAFSRPGYNVNSYGGISGMVDPDRGGFLVGVFLSDTEPADPAPPSLTFTDATIGFQSIAPSLCQTFFIGDGLTGTGSGILQKFYAPAGATRLFLGIVDALDWVGFPGYYGDNGGQFNVSATVVIGPPVIHTVWLTTNSFIFTWSAMTNQTYQIQSTASLAPANWTNLGSTITATNSTMTFSETIGTNSQQFYQVVLLP